MARKKDVSRHTHQALQITSSTPPDALAPSQLIARVVKKESGALCTCFMPKDVVTAAYDAQDTSATTLYGLINAATGNVLVAAEDDKDGKDGGALIKADRDNLTYRVMAELGEQFRSATSVMRGSHVVLDLAMAAEARAAQRRVHAEVVVVISDFRAWYRQPYWPASFSRDALPGSGLPCVQDANAGQMPEDN